MFEKLDHASRLNDNNGYPYLRTHPLTTERIGEARARQSATLSGAPAAAAASGSRFEHELMRARARVLMDPRVESMRRLQELDATAAATSGTPAERLGVLAASVQASLVLRDAARARSHARPCARTGAGGGRTAQRVLTLLQLNALAAAGDVPRAAQAMAPLDADTSRPLQLIARQPGAGRPRRGRLAAQRRRAADAGRRRRLTTAPRGRRWRSCGAASTSRCARCAPQAEAHAAVGDLGGAIDRLRAGQRSARSGGASSRPHRGLGHRRAGARPRSAAARDGRRTGRPALTVEKDAVGPERLPSERGAAARSLPQDQAGSNKRSSATSITMPAAL